MSSDPDTYLYTGSTASKDQHFGHHDNFANREEMAPRSRTGCLTCRQRKLKCDEQRPVCGQCIKAKRSCIASSSITFRHQQNPSINGEPGHGGNSLKSFYRYKETFDRGTVWVNVPKDLTFVHTDNPYNDTEDSRPGGADGYNTILGGTGEDDGKYDDGSVYSGLMQAAQAAYPAYAAHGLEALSAVASQDQYSYAPPPATMDQHDVHGEGQALANPGSPSQSAQLSALPNLEFILNPSASGHDGHPGPDGGNIDPRLHGEGAEVYATTAPDQNLGPTTTTDDAAAMNSIADALRSRQDEIHAIEF